MTLMTPQDAAKFLCISMKHLRNLTNAGEIKYICVGNGMQRERRRYALEDLQAFIEARRRQKPPLGTKLRGEPALKLRTIIGIDFQAQRAARAKAKRT